jgi:hypothetical protein
MPPLRNNKENEAELLKKHRIIGLNYRIDNFVYSIDTHPGDPGIYFENQKDVKFTLEFSTDDTIGSLVKIRDIINTLIKQHNG